MEINYEVHNYRVIGKMRSKQKKKGGELAVLVRKQCNIVCDNMDMGVSAVNEDIMIVKLECIYNTR